jgi:hypothetical protein
MRLPALLCLSACATAPISTMGMGGTSSDGGGSDAVPVTSGGLTVAVHPDVSTLLVATWDQAEAADEVWLEYSFEDQLLTTPPRALGAGPQQEVLLGIPAFVAVNIVLHSTVAGVAGADLGPVETHTDELPRGLPEPSLLLLDVTAVGDEPYVVTSVNAGSTDYYGPCYTVVLDRDGRIVWYWEVSDDRLNLFTRVSRDGTHLVVDATTYYTFDDVEPSITRLNLDLSRVDELEVPGMGLTYDELPDGGFLIDESESSHDFHLTRVEPDGSQERVWSCRPWMQDYNDEYWACAANTVLYSPERGTVLWSTFETSTVAEIDLERGELLRWFGEHPDGYDISPSDIGLELQHFPNWTPDGNILLTTHVPGDGDRQVIREFELDDDGESATQVWSYEAEEGWYGAYSGDVERRDDGHTLIGYGTGGIIEELDEDGTPVWVLDWDGHLTGHSTPVADLYALRQAWGE